MVDLVICVYNALPSLKRCLESIYIAGGYRNIIIIDDFSNSVTHEWLISYCITEKGRDIKLIRNKSNKGYTKSANIGLKETDAKYVILLNSDTIVTPYWIDNLLKCYDAYPRTGIVGPLSNNGGWQSIDYRENDFINSKVILQPIYPKVNFINGFCYMIKRDVIDKIGLFDELSFPIGYGEEDDFSIRAKDEGFELRVVDNVYIYHEKSMSFEKSMIKELKDNGYKMLCSKYGKYRVNQLIYEMNINQDLKKIKREIRQSNKLSR